MLLYYIDSDITDNQTLEATMSRYTALFIILSLVLFGCSSPEKIAAKAREQAEYNAFRTQTVQLLSTLKAGDLLCIGGEDYYVVRFITGDKLHLYAITSFSANASLDYSCEEIVYLFGKRNYSIIRGDDPKWKEVVIQQLLL